MAFLKEKELETGVKYNYWSIEGFHVNYDSVNITVTVTFYGYLNEQSKINKSKPIEVKLQTIPFGVFIDGFTKMTGFTNTDIKKALYTLKPCYEFFMDSEDVLETVVV